MENNKQKLLIFGHVLSDHCKDITRNVSVFKFNLTIKQFFTSLICSLCIFLSCLPTFAVAAYKTPQEIYMAESFYNARQEVYKSAFENIRKNREKEPWLISQSVPSSTTSTSSSGCQINPIGTGLNLNIHADKTDNQYGFFSTNYSDISNLSSAEPGNGDFSVELYLKASSSLAPGGLARILYKVQTFGAKDGESYKDKGYYIGLNAQDQSDKFWWHVGDGINGIDVFSISDVLSNQWFHVVGTWSNPTHKATLYINGYPEKNLINTSINNISTTTPIILGKRTDNNDENFIGNIRWARIYNKALSPSEVLQNYLSITAITPGSGSSSTSSSSSSSGDLICLEEDLISNDCTFTAITETITNPNQKTLSITCPAGSNFDYAYSSFGKNNTLETDEGESCIQTNTCPSAGTCSVNYSHTLCQDPILPESAKGRLIVTCTNCDQCPEEEFRTSHTNNGFIFTPIRNIIQQASTLTTNGLRNNTFIQSLWHPTGTGILGTIPTAGITSIKLYPTNNPNPSTWTEHPADKYYFYTTSTIGSCQTKNISQANDIFYIVNSTQIPIYYDQSDTYTNIQNIANHSSFKLIFQEKDNGRRRYYLNDSTNNNPELTLSNREFRKVSDNSLVAEIFPSPYDNTNETVIKKAKEIVQSIIDASGYSPKDKILQSNIFNTPSGRLVVSNLDSVPPFRFYFCGDKLFARRIDEIENPCPAPFLELSKLFYLPSSVYKQHRLIGGTYVEETPPADTLIYRTNSLYIVSGGIVSKLVPNHGSLYLEGTNDIYNAAADEIAFASQIQDAETAVTNETDDIQRLGLTVKLAQLLKKKYYDLQKIKNHISMAYPATDNFAKVDLDLLDYKIANVRNDFNNLKDTVAPEDIIENLIGLERFDAEKAFDLNLSPAAVALSRKPVELYDINVRDTIRRASYDISRLENGISTLQTNISQPAISVSQLDDYEYQSLKLKQLYWVLLEYWEPSIFSSPYQIYYKKLIDPITNLITDEKDTIKNIRDSIYTRSQTLDVSSLEGLIVSNCYPSLPGAPTESLYRTRVNYILDIIESLGIHRVRRFIANIQLIEYLKKLDLLASPNLAEQIFKTPFLFVSTSLKYRLQTKPIFDEIANFHNNYVFSVVATILQAKPDETIDHAIRVLGVEIKDVTDIIDKTSTDALGSLFNLIASDNPARNYNILTDLYLKVTTWTSLGTHSAAQDQAVITLINNAEQSITTNKILLQRKVNLIQKLELALFEYGYNFYKISGDHEKASYVAINEWMKYQMKLRSIAPNHFSRVGVELNNRKSDWSGSWNYVNALYTDDGMTGGSITAFQLEIPNRANPPTVVSSGFFTKVDQMRNLILTDIPTIPFVDIPIAKNPRYMSRAQIYQDPADLASNTLFAGALFALTYSKEFTAYEDAFLDLQRPIRKFQILSSLARSKYISVPVAQLGIVTVNELRTKLNAIKTAPYTTRLRNLLGLQFSDYGGVISNNSIFPINIFAPDRFNVIGITSGGFPGSTLTTYIVKDSSGATLTSFLKEQDAHGWITDRLNYAGNILYSIRTVTPYLNSDFFTQLASANITSTTWHDYFSRDVWLHVGAILGAAIAAIFTGGLTGVLGLVLATAVLTFGGMAGHFITSWILYHAYGLDDLNTPYTNFRRILTNTGTANIWTTLLDRLVLPLAKDFAFQWGILFVTLGLAHLLSPVLTKLITSSNSIDRIIRNNFILNKSLTSFQRLQDLGQGAWLQRFVSASVNMLLFEGVDLTSETYLNTLLGNELPTKWKLLVSVGIAIALGTRPIRRSVSTNQVVHDPIDFNRQRQRFIDLYGAANVTGSGSSFTVTTRSLDPITNLPVNSILTVVSGRTAGNSIITNARIAIFNAGLPVTNNSVSIPNGSRITTHDGLTLEFVGDHTRVARWEISDALQSISESIPVAQRADFFRDTTVIFDQTGAYVLNGFTDLSLNMRLRVRDTNRLTDAGYTIDGDPLSGSVTARQGARAISVDIGNTPIAVISSGRTLPRNVITEINNKFNAGDRPLITERITDILLAGNCSTPLIQVVDILSNVNGLKDLPPGVIAEVISRFSTNIIRQNMTNHLNNIRTASGGAISEFLLNDIAISLSTIPNLRNLPSLVIESVIRGFTTSSVRTNLTNLLNNIKGSVTPVQLETAPRQISEIANTWSLLIEKPIPKDTTGQQIIDFLNARNQRSGLIKALEIIEAIHALKDVKGASKLLMSVRSQQTNPETDQGLLGAYDEVLEPFRIFNDPAYKLIEVQKLVKLGNKTSTDIDIIFSFDGKLYYAELKSSILSWNATQAAKLIIEANNNGAIPICLFQNTTRGIYRSTLVQYANNGELVPYTGGEGAFVIKSSNTWITQLASNLRNLLIANSTPALSSDRANQLLATYLFRVDLKYKPIIQSRRGAKTIITIVDTPMKTEILTVDGLQAPPPP